MTYGLLVGYKQRSVNQWSWLFLAVVLAAVGALAIGCGSSESDQSSVGQEEEQQQEAAAPEPTPVEVVQVAYKKTASAKTAKVDFTTTMTGLPNGTSFEMAGQGVVDFENQRANLLMQTPMGEMEMRKIGTVIYQRMPEALQTQLPGQKPWLKMDFDAMTQEQFGASLSDLQGNVPNDPAQQLSYLQGVSDSVEDLGEEEVRGEPTTHYRAVLDLEKASAEQGEQARQVYDQLEQQFGTTTVPVEVWLDKDGLVRRYEMSVPLPIPPNQSSQQGASGGSQGQGQITIVEEFYDFGTPVNVEEPPADQTVDFAELMASRRAGSGRQ
jgi:hypothetical protein